MTLPPSERLFFQCVQPADAADLAPALTDPRVYEFLGGAFPANADELRQQFTRMASGPPAHLVGETWWNFAVRLRDTGQAVGRVEATLS